MNEKHAIKQSIIVLLVALAMSCACLLGCAQPPSPGSGSPANEMTVAVIVDPSAADGKVDLPADDLAVIAEDVELPEGASAYDALVATGVAIEGDSYVTSINGLAEKAAGPTYGWMYEVNDESPVVAARECALQSGDEVRWFYGSWDAS